MFKCLKHEVTNLIRNKVKEMTETLEEKLPISEFYKVIDHVTIFKSQKWWKAAIIFDNHGKQTIGIYLWVSRDGVWKRKQKMVVLGQDDWNKLKNAVEQLMPKLSTK